MAGCYLDGRADNTATARERLVSGHAATTSLGLRSLTGTKTRSAERCWSFAQLTAAQRAEAGASFALGRIGEPADTAGVVAFLASDDAAFVTGQVIYNAGGQRGPIRWTA